MLAEPLELPTGPRLQRPHPYSAVKVGGRRAYDRSRAGEVVELPEREVHVSRFELLWREEDRAGLAIDCSTGTYVRSLVAGLGDAYCLELRRTGIGPFEVADADPERVLSLNDALAFLPEVRLEGEQTKHASHGVAVPGEGEGEGAGEGMIRLTDEEGLIALALPRPDGLLKPTVGFRS
jgi:tRNA pseudouridine55 synthase